MSASREQRSFAKLQEVLELPNLIEVQRNSYKWFMNEGLKEVFEDVSPIQDFSGNLILELGKPDPDDPDYQLGYYLDKPKYEVEECKERDVSYASPLKIRAVLTNKLTGEMKEQKVFMGDFPKMTEKGTFIINGAERVIVSQLVRSPGVYFNENRDNFGKKMYGATIIPNRGAWLEFESDLNDHIFVRIDRNRKMPATVLLRALGYSTNAEIMNLFGENRFIQDTLARDTTNSTEDALIEIYKKLRPGEPSTVDSARSLLHTLFSDPKRYDLANVGRYKLNKKLKHGILYKYPEQYAQTDLFSSNGELLLREGEQITPETAQELGEEGVRLGVCEYDQLLKTYLPARRQFIRQLEIEDILCTIRYMLGLMEEESLGKVDDIDHLGNRRLRSVGELLQNQFRIGLSRMERVVRERMTIQDTDAVTPQVLINIRPVVASIKEFFGSSQLSQFMDQTNPLAELTHKRRLSALGPGGLSRERAGFDVRDVHLSHYGRMCPIETPEGPNIGLIGSLSTYARVNVFGFIETPYRKVENKRVTNEIVYLTADEEEGVNIAQANAPLDENGYFIENKVNARNPEFVIVTPEHVDYMDVSPKQVFSVATGLIPFLEHDDANRALMGANMQRQAVPLLRAQAPRVGTGMEYKTAKDSGAVVVSKKSGIVEKVTAQEIVLACDDGTKERHKLLKFTRSNQGTCANQKPIVEKGERIEADQIIADGPSTENGYLALGRNILVAFMPWDGYNYEDAILISEKAVKEDFFTSIHIEEYECDARDTKLGPEVITRDIPNVGEEILKDLDGMGIIRVGAEVRPGDILVGKVTPKGVTELTAEEKLLRAIFGDSAREVRDTSLRVPHGESGKIVDVKVFSRENNDELPPGINQLVRVYIAQKRKISEGDKMAGRHGNKGVVARILPEEDMPFLPDGTPVEIVLNPLGVPSRMNIGQVLETHLGWAARCNTNYGQGDGYYAVTPVFNGATENDILSSLKESGLPENGKTILYDGRTGEPYDNPITVGYVYMLKLHHLVDDKIHARSTGPYSLVTQQPLGGKAQFGGQRFGEMEVWALEAYGAAYTLQEILTVKSDDIVGRVKTYEAIVKGENVPEPGVPESFKVLIKELQSLGLNMKVLSEDNQEIEIKEIDDDPEDENEDMGGDSRNNHHVEYCPEDCDEEEPSETDYEDESSEYDENVSDEEMDAKCEADLQRGELYSDDDYREVEMDDLDLNNKKHFY